MCVLVIIQIALVIYNLDIDFSIKVADNLSWWGVFIPLYIFIIVAAFFFFIASILVI